VCPSNDPETGARALSNDEVHRVIEDFVAAAVRADRAGFDGIELHGAHGYLICQFLASSVNSRTDEFGGSLENRSRVLFDIVSGVRRRCRADFNVSVRLSPERFGIDTFEALQVYERLVSEANVDFIDMSLWDVFKPAADEKFEAQSLLEIFARVPRRDVRLAVAGKLYTAESVCRAVDGGADMVAIGRAAIVHHDFPRRVKSDPNFEMRTLPVPVDVLRAEGLSETFLGYMRNWPGFVAEA